jgi:hypothetical protein
VAASCGYDRAARGKSRLNIGQSQMWLSSASMLAEVGSRLKPEWSHSCRNTKAAHMYSGLKNRCNVLQFWSGCDVALDRVRMMLSMGGVK